MDMQNYPFPVDKNPEIWKGFNGGFGFVKDQATPRV